MWSLPEAWHVLVTLGQAQHSCAGDLQLSLGLSGCLVHPVPLPRSVLCTGSAWACTCPRRCFRRAVQIPCSALMQTCLSRRRDVELQFPSYWRRLHFNTALKPEAIILAEAVVHQSLPGDEQNVGKCHERLLRLICHASGQKEERRYLEDGCTGTCQMLGPLGSAGTLLPLL